MIDSYLLTSSRYSKFKILRLSSNASKHLHYRDDEKDYSDIPKNKITINSLSDYPSQKVLFTSAMYFELYSKTKQDFFRKSKHIEILENEFKSRIYKEIDKAKRVIENRIEFLDTAIDLVDQNEKNLSMIYKGYYDFVNTVWKSCDINILQQNKKIKTLEEYLEKIDEIIEKIIHFRDVSKLLCYVENKTLHVHNAFLDFAKKRKAYFELTKDLIELIAEYSRNSRFPIEIKRVKYYFYSPLREEEYLEKTFEILEDFYKKKEFQFEKEQPGSYYTPKITLKVDFEFQKIPRLKKYFEDMDIHSDYVKRKDAEDFDAFKEFLKKGRTRK